MVFVIVVLSPKAITVESQRSPLYMAEVNQFYEAQEVTDHQKHFLNKKSILELPPPLSPLLLSGTHLAQEDPLFYHIQGFVDNHAQADG